jgi:phosphatidylglycerol---prolipoprotein diacylglyceryl transferase
MPGIDIGPLHITYYGMILMTGAVAGAWLATFEARRRGYDPEIVWDGLVYILIGGIIGARLWHILLPSQTDVAKGLTTSFYLTHPLDAIAIWRGGVGIPGAILGGGLMLYIFCRRSKLPFAVWADIASPALALGQAIGRWGNFVNQELYGLPTDLPWGITIDVNHRLPELITVERYHPLFFYESSWNLLNMVFLLWLGRRLANRLLSGGFVIGLPGNLSAWSIYVGFPAFGYSQDWQHQRKPDHYAGSGPNGWYDHYLAPPRLKRFT